MDESAVDRRLTKNQKLKFPLIFCPCLTFRFSTRFDCVLMTHLFLHHKSYNSAVNRIWS